MATLRVACTTFCPSRNGAGLRALKTGSWRPASCRPPLRFMVVRCTGTDSESVGLSQTSTASMEPSTAPTASPDATDSASEDSDLISPDLASVYASCKTWIWQTYKINYAVQGHGPPVLLVHGFGASLGHWRRNIGVLAQSNTVYAIDLLGLGASEKPINFAYTMETWAEMLVDFIKEVIKKPTVLIGNSIGSLACTIVAAEAPQGLVQGIVLLNCSGGMNNKAIVDDWRIRLLLPLLWLIDFLLLQKWFASGLFQRLQSRESLKNVLQSVYCNKEAVDDELVEVIGRPARDEGALDAFVSVITGPPGPSPIKLIPKITVPILVLWGDKDTFTPIDGPVGKYFCDLPTKQDNVQLTVLKDVGHCPHDDRPELVNNELVPWLASVCSSP